METYFFSDIKIENFKSLRSVALNDCQRINIFIGKPNVGKSNILEALSFSTFIDAQIIYSNYDFRHSFKEFIRHTYFSDLIFNGDIDKKFSFSSKYITYNCMIDFNQLATISNKNIKFSNIKKYSFKTVKNSLKQTSIGGKLVTPYGENLLNILLENKKLLKECNTLLHDYQLQFFYDRNERTLKIAKVIETEADALPVIFSVDYGMIAETLQRIIFFKTAIASNQNAVLLFEEPEAHAFPPYIAHIAQEIIKSNNNQFFLTTHSPFIVNEFLENAREELAIFVVDWKGGETIVKRLSDQELHEIYQYGIDLFFNLETFI